MSAILTRFRPVGALVSLGLVWFVTWRYHVPGTDRYGMSLLGLALLVAVLWQLGLAQPPRDFDSTARRPLRPLGVALGWLIAAVGGALLGWASHRLLTGSWREEFDLAWMSWLGATVLISAGLEIAWMSSRTQVARRRRWLLPVILALVVVAGAFRLGNILTFPGEGTMFQVEDLQTGNWGSLHLDGDRGYWEYLSHHWLSAIGIWAMGPSMTGMRTPYAIVSTLKIAPMFLWMHWTVGPVGALIGTGLLTASRWDTVLSRTPNNHNSLVVAMAFALLAGPARRGRPAAYAWLGLIGGYVLYEYVAYRPLVFLIVAGATTLSLLDRSSRWPTRIARPLLTVAVIVAMAIPLFGSRLSGRVRFEYFDGWNRAKGITSYYNESDPWQEVMRKRLIRSEWAANLFFFYGDSSPLRNVRGAPQVDPFTAALLVCGLGFAVANVHRPVRILTAAGALGTVAGTLVLTGNFDVNRVGGAVPYVYALAGFGAAGIVEAFSVGWGRIARRVAIVALAGGVLGSVYVNTRFLQEYWSSPIVQQGLRSNLAYHSSWLRRNYRPGEQVVGVSPTYPFLIQANDSAWLRGIDMPGRVAHDLEAALRYWQAHPGPTLFLVLDGVAGLGIREFLASRLPGLQLEFDPDPISMGADALYGHFPRPPQALGEVLARWHCEGMKMTVEVLGEPGNRVLSQATRTVPFVTKSTWPGEAREAIYRLEGKARQLRVRVTGQFRIEQPGTYEFLVQAYAGRVQIEIDGQSLGDGRGKKIGLVAGVHTLEVSGTFEPLATDPFVRLDWMTPESPAEYQLMPLYRLAVEDPACASGAAPTDAPVPGAPAAL